MFRAYRYCLETSFHIAIKQQPWLRRSFSVMASRDPSSKFTRMSLSSFLLFKAPVTKYAQQPVAAREVDGLLNLLVTGLQIKSSQEIKPINSIHKRIRENACSPALHPQAKLLQINRWPGVRLPLPPPNRGRPSRGTESRTQKRQSLTVIRYGFMLL
jgi:hypothetical protein